MIESLFSLFQAKVSGSIHYFLHMQEVISKGY
jgi:hypothetical protein